MNKSFRRFLTLSMFGAACLTGMSNSANVRAEDTARQLAVATTKMNDWLAPSSNAKDWRVHLDLNTLDTLVGRGYRADVSKLRQIAGRFQTGASAQHSNFQSVADAIEAHASLIEAANTQYPAAQYSGDQIEAWTQAFTAAIDELSPMSSAQLNHARLLTLQDVQHLDQFLTERGPLSADQLVEPLQIIPAEDSSEGTDQLGTFDLSQTLLLLQQAIELDWESNGEATEETEDDEETLSLREIRVGLRSEIDKLEFYAKQDPNPYVTSALLRLQDYELKLNLGSRENLPQLLKPQMQRLIEALPEWKVDGDRLKQTELVRILGLLEVTQQAPALTAAFKRTFWQNNALFTVSESLVNRFASRPVQDTSPVNEIILDNQVCGVANTNGQVSIDFVPNDYQAHFSLHLTGTVDSDNYSPVGPLTVYTGSQAQIEARRSIYLNSGGWFEKAPYGSANLQSFFKGTSCGRLISQVAAKQFENQRDGAQRVGARRAENRLLNQFNQETTEALTNGRTQMKQQQSQSAAVKPYRPILYVLTTEHFLHGFANRYGDSQMTAMFQPAEMSVPSDVSAQIHDSLLNNYLEDELGGLTLTDQDLERINQKQAEAAAKAGIERSISDQDEPTDAEDVQPRDPFELTLDSSRPVDIHFADQLVYVTINVRRFQSQGQSISDVQVKTRFKMHYDSENGVPGIRVQQLGGIKAELKDPDDIELDSATILNLIETTINDELKRQRTDSDQQGIWLPLNLIDRSKIPALANVEGAELLDQAKLVAASFDQGWATFAWQLPTASAGYSIGDQATSVVQSDLPAIATAEEFKAMAQPEETDNGESNQ